jgi:hypothetical protein
VRANSADEQRSPQSAARRSPSLGHTAGAAEPRTCKAMSSLACRMARYVRRQTDLVSVLPIHTDGLQVATWQRWTLYPPLIRAILSYGRHSPDQFIYFQS